MARYKRETLAEIKTTKGYDARKAEHLFVSYPNVQTVIISDTALTHNGWKAAEESETLYYRKSTGGKWGRSSQLTFVVAARKKESA